MILGNTHIGTVGEIDFSARLNELGGIDLAPTPGDLVILTVGYECRDSRDKFGFIQIGYKQDEVPSVCWNVNGFFETNKIGLYEKAVEMLARNN